MATKKRIVYPIQLDHELDEKIALAAERLCMPKAEVMRMAMAIGLEHLRRINYDLVGHLCQTPERREPLKVADEGNAQSPSFPADGVRRAVKYPARGRKA